MNASEKALDRDELIESLTFGELIDFIHRRVNPLAKLSPKQAGQHDDETPKLTIDEYKIVSTGENTARLVKSGRRVWYDVDTASHEAEIGESSISHEKLVGDDFPSVYSLGDETIRPKHIDVESLHAVRCSCANNSISRKCECHVPVVDVATTHGSSPSVGGQGAATPQTGESIVGASTPERGGSAVAAGSSSPELAATLQKVFDEIMKLALECKDSADPSGAIVAYKCLAITQSAMWGEL